MKKPTDLHECEPPSHVLYSVAGPCNSHVCLDMNLAALRSPQFRGPMYAIYHIDWAILLIVVALELGRILRS
jgi:hypothetical protein